MSLRRSSRNLTRPILEHEVTTDGRPQQAVTSRKRIRKSKLAKRNPIAAVAQGVGATKAKKDSEAMPPPTTPNKRRKLAQLEKSKLPPSTPTPSAIGLTTNSSNNYSSGDIIDPVPPPTRRVDVHDSNATLITPGGTQYLPPYSNFEETSPSKPASSTTNKTLLKEACAHLIKVDPRLKPVIERHYCHVFSPEGLAERIDPFRSLASGIMAQQVSGAAASSIKNKFIALFPPELCPSGFPPPGIVANTDISTLRSAGLSQRKAEYIQGLAAKFEYRELTVQMLMEGSDEEVMENLVTVRGLGAWSVEMFMCFGLKRMDIFSTGDLGVQRGMAAFVGRDVGKLKAKGGGKWKYMSQKDMLEMSEKFAPYRSLFMWYMWRIEDVNVDAVQDNARE